MEGKDYIVVPPSYCMLYYTNQREGAWLMFVIRGGEWVVRKNLHFLVTQPCTTTRPGSSLDLEMKRPDRIDLSRFRNELTALGVPARHVLLRVVLPFLFFSPLLLSLLFHSPSLFPFLLLLFCFSSFPLLHVFFRVFFSSLLLFLPLASRLVQILILGENSDQILLSIWTKPLHPLCGTFFRFIVQFSIPFFCFIPTYFLALLADWGKISIVFPFVFSAFLCCGFLKRSRLISLLHFFSPSFAAKSFPKKYGRV